MAGALDDVRDSLVLQCAGRGRVGRVTTIGLAEGLRSGRIMGAVRGVERTSRVPRRLRGKQQEVGLQKGLKLGSARGLR